MVRRQGGALCTSCHDPTKPALTGKHPGMPLATVNCISCHDPHVQFKGRHALLWQSQHTPFMRGDCKMCHTAKGSPTTVAKGSALCLKCHPALKADLEKTHVHTALRIGQECLSCHGAHGGPAVPNLRRTQPALCLDCHDRKQFEGTVRHKALDQGCTTCHVPHGSDAAGLLKQPPPQLCQTCHTDLSKHFHKTSSTRPDPRTGEALTCLSRHSPHSAPLEGLLQFEPKRELCIQCHDPSMAPAPHAPRPGAPNPQGAKPAPPTPQGAKPEAPKPDAPKPAAPKPPK